MNINEAISQLKVIRENLNRANLEYASPKTIEFKLTSIAAIDLVLSRLEGGKTPSYLQK